MDLILTESSNDVKFNYSCKYSPSEGGDVVETNEGIVQFALDPMPKQQTITRGKGARVNVDAKSLTSYLSEMTFCNYPQLLLIFPERQTQVEMMGKKTTQASHRALLFEEELILKPHADNTDQEYMSYTLIAFTVFSESHGRGHYKAYCKKEDTSDWYLFDDEKITKKRGDVETLTTKGNIGTQVTSLYYLKNEEATITKSVEKAQEELVQEVDHGYDAVVKDLAQIQEKGGKETNTDLAQDKLIQEVDLVYDAVDTEESDSAQIQEKGGAETITDLISEEEEDMTSPNAPTKAPIDLTTASGTINGAYITYSTQHNNIHRSHQIAFPEEEGGLMMQNKHMSTISTTTTMMTASGTSNGVYISSPIQHNNILRSHHLFFTASNDERLCDNDEDIAQHDHDFDGMYEALKSLSNSPVPPHYTEEMISPASRFTFVTRQLTGECLGEPFRHFLNLSIAEDFQIAEAYRCICRGEGFCFHNEERLTKEGPDMVVFNFADEMIPVAVKMWKSCLSKDQKVPIDSCVRIMCQR